MCPFCGLTLAAPTPRLPRLAGRLSRAAVFGASLAGCYTSAAPAQQPPTQIAPPPPPPDETAQVTAPPPPPPPIDPNPNPNPNPSGGQFAKPPPGAMGGVDVLVTEGQTPLRNRDIWLSRNDGTPVREGRTDNAGHFIVRDLVPGTYQIATEALPGPPPRHGPRDVPPGMPAMSSVTVTAGVIAKVTMTLFRPPPIIDNSPCCKPYGAPPARRRTV
jgi:hypothetical protein